jgi:hypothetical protein
MVRERILAFAMSEKLSEPQLEVVAGGAAAEVTFETTYGANGRDINLDF